MIRMLRQGRVKVYVQNSGEVSGGDCVVIKEGCSNPCANFKSEERILRMLEPDGKTPKCYSLREHMNRFTLEMELLQGDDLSQSSLIDIDRICGRRRLIRHLIDNLHYLHQHHIIHMDYTFDNLMWTNRNYEKLNIIDFGLSKEFREDDDSYMTFFNSSFGKYDFYAPEFLSNISFDGRRYDIFCLGLMVFYYLTNEIFFKGIGYNNHKIVLEDLTYFGVKDYIRHLHPNVKLSEDEMDFLMKCLDPDNSNRPLTDHLIQHYFYTSLTN